MFNIKHNVRRQRERLQQAIVWRLPKWIVYWSTIRSGAYATTGKDGGQVVPELTLLDTLKRWEDN